MLSMISSSQNDSAQCVDTQDVDGIQFTGLPGRWYVAHTKPRQEKLLATSLARFGIYNYLPLRQRVTRSAATRRLSRSLVPVFPGYLFFNGTDEQNDKLIEEWPIPLKRVGAPVWHLHEPIKRLQRLCGSWPRVCMGSSGQYREIGSTQWSHRMDEAWNAISDGAGRCHTWIHMLRGLQLTKSDYQWPFASVDSNDIARNYKDYGVSAGQLAARWDALQCPQKWCRREQRRLEI